MSNLSEKAIQILRQTNDGNWLRPYQLQIVESAVNGMLSELGQQLFDLLVQITIDGTYHKYATVADMVAKLENPEMSTPAPALHGVEHLDYDNQGYIYWKGVQVEHYDHPLSPKMKESAIELGERCRHLEAIGVPIAMKTVIWRWDWFKEMPADCPYKAVMATCPELYEHKDGIQAAIVLKTVAYHYDGQQWWEYKREVVSDPWHRDEWDWSVLVADDDRPPAQTMEVRGFLWANVGQTEKGSISWASWDAISGWLSRFNTPTDLTDLPAEDERLRRAV